VTEPSPLESESAQVKDLQAEITQLTKRLQELESLSQEKEKPERDEKPTKKKSSKQTWSAPLHHKQLDTPPVLIKPLFITLSLLPHPPECFQVESSLLGNGANVIQMELIPLVVSYSSFKVHLPLTSFHREV
jgi:hypothetical protein